MPPPPHIERHFTATAVVRDVVIGMSDGLTVPFALAAGLSGAAVPTAIVVTAGLAEIAAGSIAMGLGGYLAAKTESEHYLTERQRELRETMEMPDREAEEVATVFRDYGLSEEHVTAVVEAIRADTDRWVDFMMRFELGLEAPDPARARQSAALIGGSYIVGGLIPLAPYMIVADTATALWVSVLVTLLALCVFGYIKGRLTGFNPWRGAGQTAFIGGMAAAAAFAIAKAIG